MRTKGQFDGRQKRVEMHTEDVTMGAGSGSIAVTFSQAFPTAPAVLVVPHEGDVNTGASYSATSITRTGFTLQISASSYDAGDVLKVAWMAAEKS